MRFEMLNPRMLLSTMYLVLSLALIAAVLYPRIISEWYQTCIHVLGFMLLVCMIGVEELTRECDVLRSSLTGKDEELARSRGKLDASEKQRRNLLRRPSGGADPGLHALVKRLKRQNEALKKDVATFEKTLTSLVAAPEACVLCFTNQPVMLVKDCNHLNMCAACEQVYRDRNKDTPTNFKCLTCFGPIRDTQDFTG